MKTIGMIVLSLLLALIVMRIMPYEPYDTPNGMLQKGYNLVTYANPFRYLSSKLKEDSFLRKNKIPFIKKPWLYNRRDGIRFTDRLDDRFTNDKNRRYGEPGAIPPLSVNAKETFEGLLPATDPETDPFVPSLEEAATRVHFTEDQAIVKNDVQDLRGLSPEMIIPPAQVTPFGQSTRDELTGMGILQNPFTDTLALPRPILPTFT